MARSHMNYGVVAFGYARRDGELHERVGSSSIRHFDQRLGMTRMHNEALQWAKYEGHDAYQLQRCPNGYSSAKPASRMVEVT